MMQTERVKIGQLEIRYLIDGSTEGGMGLFEMTVPPGSNVPPPHSHTHNEECVYVLEGTLRYTVDDLTRDLRPGEWMRTPRGAIHGFSNPHQEPARVLISVCNTSATSLPLSMPAARRTVHNFLQSWDVMALFRHLRVPDGYTGARPSQLTGGCCRPSPGMATRLVLPV